MEDPLRSHGVLSPSSPNINKGSPTWLLILLAALHLSGCLGHFLLSVVSKSVAKDIHYGTRACLPNHTSTTTSHECSLANSSSTCSLLEDCSWGWSGLGLDYQLLVGPSFMAVFTVSSVGWGLAADNCVRRISRITLLAISSILFSFAMLLTAYANSYGELVLLRMISALGIAGIGPIAPGLIYDSFGEKHRAMAMGFFHWGIYLGGGLSNAVGKGVSDLHLFSQGWRGAFLVSGFPGLILALLLITTASDPWRKEGRGLSSISSGGSCHSAVYLSEEKVPDEEDEEEIQTDCEREEEEEAQVLIRDEKFSYQNVPNNNNNDLNLSHDKHRRRSSVLSFLLQPTVLFLGLGACVRQSAGYSWAYNGALYFQTYYESFDASWWLTWSTILGGSAGVVLGGGLSDRLVSKLGLSARALVLAASQICAAPFALGVLWTDPPYSFAFLLVTYLFAEMWYGVVFAILVELLPPSGKSLGMAVALFVINNIGGNAPVLAAPLSVLTSYRVALTLLYPAALLASSILFIGGYLSLRQQYL